MSKGKENGIVLIEQAGPADVLKYQKVTLEQPGHQQVLIAQKAIGVNFLDVFFRNGTFPLEKYPTPIGLEAAGVIEELGTDVKDFAVGDRVAYYSSNGAYADKRIINTSEIFRLPDDISFEQAASVMIKGLTAHMLMKENYPVKAGEIVLIHAMTGGVGTLLSQWARAVGAIVIGTVGTKEKKAIALKRGFEHVIDLQSQDIADEVNRITQGHGVDVAYDGTGKATFQKSLPIVKEGGSVVLYGWPSGMPDLNDDLISKRKIKFSQAILNNYPLYQDKTGKGLSEIFDLLRAGIYEEKPLIYPLSQAAAAHADLESRKTTGSIILQP